MGCSQVRAQTFLDAYASLREVAALERNLLFRTPMDFVLNNQWMSEIRTEFGLPLVDFLKLMEKYRPPDAIPTGGVTFNETAAETCRAPFAWVLYGHYRGHSAISLSWLHPEEHAKPDGLIHILWYKTPHGRYETRNLDFVDDACSDHDEESVVRCIREARGLKKEHYDAILARHETRLKLLPLFRERLEIVSLRGPGSLFAAEMEKCPCLDRLMSVLLKFPETPFGRWYINEFPNHPYFAQKIATLRSRPHIDEDGVQMRQSTIARAVKNRIDLFVKQMRAEVGEAFGSSRALKASSFGFYSDTYLSRTGTVKPAGKGKHREDRVFYPSFSRIGRESFGYQYVYVRGDYENELRFCGSVEKYDADVRAIQEDEAVLHASETWGTVNQLLAKDHHLESLGRVAELSEERVLEIQEELQGRFGLMDDWFLFDWFEVVKVVRENDNPHPGDVPSPEDDPAFWITNKDSIVAYQEKVLHCLAMAGMRKEVEAARKGLRAARQMSDEYLAEYKRKVGEHREHMAEWIEEAKDSIRESVLEKLREGPLIDVPLRARRKIPRRGPVVVASSSAAPVGTRSAADGVSSSERATEYRSGAGFMTKSNAADHDYRQQQDDFMTSMDRMREADQARREAETAHMSSLLTGDL